MARMLLASTNKGKLQEIQDLLDGIDTELFLPSDLGLNLEVEEHGSTYAENAALKAQAFALASGLLCLADDSGLEVDVLGGEPGLHSARYSPQPGATDADRRHYLLEKLQGRPRPWTAHFHCTLALALPDGTLHFAEGDCPGEIIPEERGDNGFGYDPIFVMSGLGRTMSELSMAEKNQLSHRARAVHAALPLIAALLKEAS
jgi:XTP/dITP diphosphohydrolase